MDYGLLKKYTHEINVLYVEDDNDLRKEFSELLKDIFPNVKQASNGEEALNIYKNYYEQNNTYFELIISDIKMPKMDGIELIKNIYDINKEQNVVVLSARNEFDYLLPLVNMGIQHFFTKPIVFDDFLKEIYNISYKIYTNTQSKEDNTLLKIAKNVYWDKDKKQLVKDEKTVKLTKTEFLLLDKLTSDNARVFTIEELFILIWGSIYDEKATKDNLKNIISRLRKKHSEIEIVSVYAMGYKLEIKN